MILELDKIFDTDLSFTGQYLGDEKIRKSKLKLALFLRFNGSKRTPKGARANGLFILNFIANIRGDLYGLKDYEKQLEVDKSTDVR